MIRTDTAYLAMVDHISSMDATPLSAIVNDPQALSYKGVEDDGACVVDHAKTCQAGLVAFDANHFSRA